MNPTNVIDAVRQSLTILIPLLATARGHMADGLEWIRGTGFGRVGSPQNESFGTWPANCELVSWTDSL